MSLNLFYKHPSNTDLYWIRTDGNQWAGNGKILIELPTPPPVHTPQSSGTPATALSPAASPEGLLMFYKAGNSNDLMWSWLGVGELWSGDETVHDPKGRIRPPKSDHSPAAAVYRNHLFLIYKDENSNDICAANMDFNGVWSWGIPIADIDKSSVSPKTNISPSVAVYQDKLYIVYKGQSSTDIYFTICDATYWYGDNKIASQPGAIKPKSSSNPSLVVFNDLLYMIYKGPNNNDLNYAYFDGYVWHGNSEIYKQPGGIRPQSDSNPGLAVFQGRLHMVYKSPHNNDLNIAYFDGTTWSGNTEIWKEPPGLKPLSDHSPNAVVYLN